MPLLDRIFAGDEELGKKDDDHRPGTASALPSSWAPRHSIPAFRRRRYFYGIIAILFVYLFIKNIPSDLGSNSQRRDSRVPVRGIPSPVPSVLPSGQPPRPKEPSEAEKYYFNGPIKFYKLAVSLHSVAGLSGYNGANKNVLYAASNLKSAAEILPLACEMAKWKRNDVHFALMGRDDIEVSAIKKLNGVSPECNIHWHDARPDYSVWSSNFRMEVSVTAGMGHIQTFVHPQVIITDHQSREDAFFTKAIRTKAAAMDKSVIELPVNAAENLMWVTRLDSGSLAAWHTTYVDLVIHAPPKSSGSLLRLLKTIEAADYFGARRPHLTIELPADIDPPTAHFLENLVWPPIDWSGAPHASQVTLRHRIPRHSPTTGEASSHLIESFYPARPKDSHVLLVSPQTELSPIYYHYVMYNLLEYKYSTYGQRTHESRNLLGFSLELPSTYLNGSTSLEPPVPEPGDARRSSREAREPTPFLWQAPNSNAALYFGDKWVELHSFLSARTSLQDPRLPADQRPPTRKKLISESYPSWMEYFQELMRARGYFLLYPHFPNSDDAIITIHEELRQPPEEYSKKPSSPSAAAPPNLDPNDPFTTDPSAFEPILPVQAEAPLLVKDLISLLPYSGDLPEITHLPILSHEGNVLSKADSISAARHFTDEFRKEIGRCRNNDKVAIEPMSAKDLFCNLDRAEGTLSAAPVKEKSKEVKVDTKGTKNTKEKGGEDSHEKSKAGSQKKLPSKGEETDKTGNKGENEHAKAKAGEGNGEKSGRKSPGKPAESTQKKTPSEENRDGKNDRAEDEFTAHLQRQGGKGNDGAGLPKVEKESETPKPLLGGGETDDKKETGKATNAATESEVKTATSDGIKKQSVDTTVTETEATATATAAGTDAEKTAQPAKKQQEQDPKQGSDPTPSTEAGKSVKKQERKPEKRGSQDYAAQGGTESKTEKPGKPTKEAAKPGEERKPGW